MLAAGWVGRVQDELPGGTRWGRGLRQNVDNWVLLVDPANLRLADVYRLFVFEAGIADEATPATPLALDTQALARQVEAAVEGGLEQTLAGHFASSDPFPHG